MGHAMEQAEGVPIGDLEGCFRKIGFLGVKGSGFRGLGFRGLGFKV